MKQNNNYTPSNERRLSIVTIRKIVFYGLTSLVVLLTGICGIQAYNNHKYKVELKKQEKIVTFLYKQEDNLLKQLEDLQAKYNGDRQNINY